MRRWPAAGDTIRPLTLDRDDVNFAKALTDTLEQLAYRQQRYYSNSTVLYITHRGVEAFKRKRIRISSKRRGTSLSSTTTRWSTKKLSFGKGSRYICKASLSRLCGWEMFTTELHSVLSSSFTWFISEDVLSTSWIVHHQNSTFTLASLCSVPFRLQQSMDCF